MAKLPVKEAHFQAALIEAAQLFKWTVWHVSDSRKQAGGTLVGDSRTAGLPDLILAHPTHGVMFWELKSDKGTIRPNQTAALTVLAEAFKAQGTHPDEVSLRVGVRRPADWNQLVQILKEGP